MPAEGEGGRAGASCAGLKERPLQSEGFFFLSLFFFFSTWATAGFELKPRPVTRPGNVAEWFDVLLTLLTG